MKAIVSVDDEMLITNLLHRIYPCPHRVGRLDNAQGLEDEV